MRTPAFSTRHRSPNPFATTDAARRVSALPKALRTTTPWTSLLFGAALVAACGGGGSDPYDIFPLWVETDVVVTDLDGDGCSDVLMTASLSSDASHDEGRLTVYRQTAAGRFTVETYIVGTYPWTLTVGDVDGDGAPDVAIVDVGTTDRVQPHRLWLLRQDPAQRGHLLAAQAVIDGPSIYTVAIADLDGDGAPDLALDDNVQSAAGSGVTVLYQSRTARGTFGPPMIVPLSGRAGSVASGDVDGRADLVVHTVTSPPGALSPTDSVLSVLRQQADGTLVRATTLMPRNGLNSQRLAVLDADGDGRSDILHYQTPCCSTPSNLTALLQEPIGTFRDVATPIALPAPEDVAFGDFDGDGRIDAAGVTSVRSQITLLRQMADGTFVVSATIAAPGTTVTRIAAGDVDGDGRADLVVIGDDNRTWVFLHTAGQSATFGAPRLLP